MVLLLALNTNACSNLNLFNVDPGQLKGEIEDAGETGDSGEYNVYSTFQSHEPDFDYLKSLEIEEKINKIKWLPQQNAAHFLLSTNGETRVRHNISTTRVPTS